jgi:hypothetical protein
VLRILLTNYLSLLPRQDIKPLGTYCLWYKWYCIYTTKQIIRNMFVEVNYYFAEKLLASTFTPGPIVVLTAMFFM